MFQDLKKDAGSTPGRSDFNKLVDRLESLVIRPGPGLFMRQTSTGTTLWTRRARGIGGGGGRFPVSFNATTQKLHVGEGSVAWSVSEQPDSVTRPYIPKLDGVSLSLTPGWDIAGKTPGTEYEVICIYHSSAGRMVLHEKDGEEELEVEDGERARLIATVTFQSAGTGLAIAELVQRWQDDIEQAGEESLSSSTSGISTSEDDSDSDGDSDGGSDDESDDSSGSSSSSSSSGEECCPGSVIQSAVVMMVGAQVSLPPEEWEPDTGLGYGGSGAEDTLIVVETKVTPPEDPCDQYRGRLWLTVEVRGGARKRVNLGTAMGGTYTTEHILSATACETMPVTACVELFGSSPSGSTPELGICCGDSIDVQTPPIIGEPPCTPP